MSTVVLDSSNLEAMVMDATGEGLAVDGAATGKANTTDAPEKANKTDKIADSLVERALQLSLFAPNHKLTFPWAYFWTGPGVREKLANLVVELKSAKEPLNEIKKKAAYDKTRNPSHLILIGTRRGDPSRAHEDYASLACAVQIAILYLWEQGVGTKWSTGAYFTGPRAYEIIGVSPEEYKLEGGLLIGVPQIMPPAPERPPLVQFLHRTS